MDQKKDHFLSIGKSRGGWTTQVHAVVDACGRLITAGLSPGQTHDLKPAIPLLEGLPVAQRPRLLLADRGYDSNPFRTGLRNRRIRPVIPGKKNRKTPIRHDVEAYKNRHRVECFFSRMKPWSALALRREKSDIAFRAVFDLFVLKDWLQHIK